MQASSHIFFSCKETVFLNLLGWKLFLPITEKLFHLYIVQFSKNLYPFGLVEISRIELLTPCLQGRCSPS